LARAFSARAITTYRASGFFFGARVGQAPRRGIGDANTVVALGILLALAIRPNQGIARIAAANAYLAGLPGSLGRETTGNALWCLSP
jgi:hydrogenase/urease accessory protein HupE